jgi:hypothetical protein
MERHKTSFVVAHLNSNFSRIGYLIRTGRVHPARDESGDYVWSDANIEQARVALAKLRPQKKRTVRV